jgi:hypothetical protein
MVGLEMIWDSNAFSMEEFNAYEKGWVLGFFTPPQLCQPFSMEI